MYRTTSFAMSALVATAFAVAPAASRAADAPVPPASTAPPAGSAGAPPPVAAPAATPAPASAPPTAQAQPSTFQGETPHRQGITLWGALPWGGYGVGGRYMMPLAIGPVINSPSIRDSWALEFGVDYLHIDVGSGIIDISYNELLPVAGIMWNFWFSQKFSLYPKAELGYAFAWLSQDYGPAAGSYGGLFISGAAGLLYRLENGLTLRAEAGISGLKAGVGWLF